MQAVGDGSSPPIMIFLKWFDVQRQTLLGQGKVFVGKNQKVAELCPLICERMGWAPTTPLKLYEVSCPKLQQEEVSLIVCRSLKQEIKAGMIEQMKLRQTFVTSEIQDGDVICFQAEISDKE